MQRTSPLAIAEAFEPWLTVAELARLELTSKRQVYAALDRGMKHSRVGQRIRVRRSDWHAWHAAHAIGGEAA